MRPVFLFAHALISACAYPLAVVGNVTTVDPPPVLPGVGEPAAEVAGTAVGDSGEPTVVVTEGGWLVGVSLEQPASETAAARASAAVMRGARAVMAVRIGAGSPARPPAV